MSLSLAALPPAVDNSSESAPGVTSNDSRALRVTLLASRVLLLLQAIWLTGFSIFELRHDDLTYDYAIFLQAGSEIAHGHLNPFSSIKGFPFWQNHGELLMWVLAPLTRIPPIGLWLLIAQDLATVAIGWVLVSWVRDWTRSKTCPGRLPPALAVALAAFMWIGNPWVYFSAAFDFHLQAFAVLTLILAARELLSGQWKRAAIFIALTLATGDVAGTYVFGLGATGMLITYKDRQHLRQCLFVAFAGLSWTILLTAFHANLGSDLVSGYGYLAGASRHPSLLSIVWGTLAHPSRLGSHLTVTGSEMYLAVVPLGVIGILTPWGLIPALTLIANGAHSGTNFARPGIFQALPVWPFILLGTMWLLGRLQRFDRRTLYSGVLAAWISICSLLTAYTYLPVYPHERLAVTTREASTVRTDLRMIPGSAEVVVCDGISGWFGARDDVSIVMTNPFRVQLSGRAIYFVLAPTVGIEDGRDVEGILHIVRSQLHATPISNRDGVWVLRWLPAVGQKELVLDAPESGMPSS